MQTNLTILEPFNSCVYQRNNAGFASIPVGGLAPLGLASVLATLLPVKGGTPVVQTIPCDSAGNFAGTIEALGGWYSLTVTAGDLQATVSRVGAGEVFILFGHSFVSGGYDVNNQKPAIDERAVTLLDTFPGVVANQFGRLQNSIGPFQRFPDAWGQLSDLLINRLNVPVLFYGAAYGGSSLTMVKEVIFNEPLSKLPPGYTPGIRQPFAPFERVLTEYAPKTGVRAVLMEHGYNDRGITSAQFADNFKLVFNYIRENYGFPLLPVVLVQEQLTAVQGTLYDIETAKGQQSLFGNYPQLYKGPDFNDTIWNGKFDTADHLTGIAVDTYASEWSKALSDAFFRESNATTAAVADVFPVALYNAPTNDLKPKDWLILLAAAIVLVLLFIRRSSLLMWLFLLLGIVALGRLTNKI